MAKNDKSTQSVQNRLRKAGAFPLKYAKGLGKMVFLGGGREFFTTELPVARSLYEVNEDFLKDTIKFLKNPAESVGRRVRISLESDAYKNATEIVKYAIDDLKTGNFYDESRALGRDGGEFGDFDDDFGDFGGFDMDGFDENGDWDGNESDTSEKTDQKVDVEIAKAQEDAADDRTRAEIGAIGTAAGAMIENDNKNAQRSVIMSIRQHAQDISAMENLIVVNSAIHESMNNNAKIAVELTREVNNQIIAEVKSISTLLTEIRDHTIPKEEKEEYKRQDLPYDDMTGALDVKKWITSSAKRFWEDGPWSALSMLGIGGDMVFEILKANPWNAIIGRPLFDKLLPKGFKEDTNYFNEMVQGFAPALLSKFNGMAEKIESGEDDTTNGIVGTVLKAMGFKPRSSSFADTSMRDFNQKAEFTNKVAKAITDVMPTQLAQIISLMSGERPKLFNYRTGKFEDMGEIMARRERDLNDLAGKMRITSQLQSITRSSLAGQDEVKRFDDLIYQMMQRAAERSELINPWDRENIEAIAPDSASKEEITILQGLLQSLSQKDQMNLSREIYSARASRDRNTFNVNKDMHDSGEIMVHSGITTDPFYGLVRARSRKSRSGLSKEDFNKITKESSDIRIGKHKIRTPMELLTDIRDTIAGGVITYSFGMGDVDDAQYSTVLHNILGQDAANTILMSRERALKNLRRDVEYNDKIEQEASEVSRREEEDKKRKKKQKEKQMLDPDAEKDSVENLANGHGAEYAAAHFRNVHLRNVSHEERMQTDAVYRAMYNAKEDAKNSLGEIGEKTGFSKLIDTVSGFVQEPFKLVQLGMKSMDAVMFRAIYGPDADNFLDLNEEDQPYLIKLVSNVLKGDVNNFSDFLTETFNGVKDKLIGEDGIFTKIGNKLLDTISPITTKITDKITEGINWIKDKTIGHRENDQADGDFTGGIFSNLINRTGGEYGQFKGSLLTRINGAVDNLLFGKPGSENKGRRMVYDGVQLDDDGNITGGGYHYEYGGVIGTLRRGFDGVNRFLFGDDLLESDSKTLFNDVKEEVKQAAPGMVLGAGVGALGTAGVGFLTSLWLPGGPLLGGIIGAGVGMISASDKLKDRIFGEVGEDGEREGGLISKDVQKWTKHFLPGAGIGAGAGALLGNMGILPAGLGPIIGGVFGSVAGMMASSDRVKRAIFGEEGDDDSGFFSKNLRKQIMENIPSTLLGGLAGAKAWGLISGMGLIPGLAMLPGGPVLTAIGATAGMLSGPEIKAFLFGGDVKRKDDHGNTVTEHQDGVFKRVFEIGRDRIFDPFFKAMDHAGKAVKNWFNKDIVDPFTAALQPMKNAMMEAGDHVKGAFINLGEKIKESLDGVFEKSFGSDLKTFMKENVFDKLNGMVSKLFEFIGKVIGGIIASPFKALNFMFSGGIPEEARDTDDENKPKEQKPETPVQNSIRNQEKKDKKQESKKNKSRNVSDIRFDDHGQVIYDWDEDDDDNEPEDTSPNENQPDEDDEPVTMADALIEEQERREEEEKKKNNPPRGNVQRQLMADVINREKKKRGKKKSKRQRREEKRRKREDRRNNRNASINQAAIDEIISDSGEDESSEESEEPPQEEQTVADRLRNDAIEAHRDERTSPRDLMRSRGAQFFAGHAEGNNKGRNLRAAMDPYAPKNSLVGDILEKIKSAIETAETNIINKLDTINTGVHDIYVAITSRGGSGGGGSGDGSQPGKKEGFFKRAGNKIKSAAGKVKDAILHPINFIKDGFGNIAKSIRSTLSGAIRAVGAFGEAVANAAIKIPAVIASFVVGVGKVTKSLVDAVGPAVSFLAKGIKDVVTGFASAAGEFIKGTFGTLWKITKTAVPGAAKVIGGVASGLVSGAGHVVGGAARAVGGVVGAVGEKAKKIGGAVSEFAQGALGKVGGFFKGIKNKIDRANAQKVLLVGGNVEEIGGHPATVMLFHGKPLFAPMNAVPVYIAGSFDYKHSDDDKKRRREAIRDFIDGLRGNQSEDQESDAGDTKKENSLKYKATRQLVKVRRGVRGLLDKFKQHQPTGETANVNDYSEDADGQLSFGDGTETQSQTNQSKPGSLRDKVRGLANNVNFGIGGMMEKLEARKTQRDMHRQMQEYRRHYDRTDESVERSNNPREVIDRVVQSADSPDEIQAARDVVSFNTGLSEIQQAQDDGEKKGGLLSKILGGIFGGGKKLLGSVFGKLLGGGKAASGIAGALKSTVLPAAAELGSGAATMYNLFGDSGNRTWGLRTATNSIQGLARAVAGNADELANAGPIKKAITKLITSFMNNGTVQKMFGKLKSKIPQLTSSLVGKLSGSVLDRAMHSGAAQALKSAGKQIMAFASGGTLQIAFSIADFISGFGNAKKYFNVFGSDVSLGMRLTSAVVNTLGGLLSQIPHVGPILSVAASMMQDQIVQLVYGILADDADKEELAQDQQKLQKATDEYNAANGTNLTTDEYAKQFNEDGSKRKGILGRVGGAIVNGAKAVANLPRAAIGAVAKGASWLGNGILNVKDKIGAGINTAGHWLANGANMVGDKLLNFADNAPQIIKEFLDNLGDKVMNVAIGIPKAIGKFIGEGLGTMIKDAGGLGQFVTNLGSGIVKFLVGDSENGRDGFILKLAEGIGKIALSGIKLLIKSPEIILNIALGIGKGIAKTALAVLGSPLTLAVGIGEGIMNKFSGIKESFMGLIDSGKNFVNTITGGFNNIVKKVSEAFNTITGWMPWNWGKDKEKQIQDADQVQEQPEKWSGARGGGAGRRKNIEPAYGQGPGNDTDVKTKLIEETRRPVPYHGGLESNMSGYVQNILNKVNQVATTGIAKTNEIVSNIATQIVPDQGLLTGILDKLNDVGSGIGSRIIEISNTKFGADNVATGIFHSIGLGIGDSLIGIIQEESGPGNKKNAISSVVANVSSQASIASMQKATKEAQKNTTPWYKKAADTVSDWMPWNWGKGPEDDIQTNEIDNIDAGQWGTGRVTAMNQADSKWNRSGDNMKRTGCGPTAAAMMASAYGKSGDPLEASKESYQMGMRASDGGTNPDFFSAYGAKKGISMHQGPNDPGLINDRVSHGQPVTMMGKGGPFGKNMHYMVAESGDGKGNLNIVDPNGGKRKKVSVSDMIRNTKSTIYSGFGKGPEDDTKSALTPTAIAFNEKQMTRTAPEGTVLSEITATSKADEFVSIAENEVGYVEKASNKDLDDKTANVGNSNFTKYGKFAGCNGQPWCAAFVSWCANQAGILGTLVPKFTSCSAGVSWFESHGMWKDPRYRPMKGDIIFYRGGDFGSGHVGIVYASDDKYVYTIEGNTSAGNGSQNNGGCVAKKKRPINLNSIRGYAAINYGDARSYGVPGSTSLDNSVTYGSTTSYSDTMPSGSSSGAEPSSGGLLGKISSTYSNIISPINSISSAIGSKLASLFNPLNGENAESTTEPSTAMSSNSTESASSSSKSYSYNTSTNMSNISPTAIATMEKRGALTGGNDWLGKHVAKYESGSKGPRMISSGSGDHGGVSFGTYQFPSYGKTTTTSGTLPEFWNKYYAQMFPGVSPGNNNEFKNAWLAAVDKDENQFKANEAAFISKEYYDISRNKMIKNMNFDPSAYSRAAQEAVWSGSVQYGPESFANLTKKAMDGASPNGIQETEFLDKLYDHKYNTVDSWFKKCSESVKNGVRNRIKNERETVRELEGQPPIQWGAGPGKLETQDIDIQDSEEMGKGVSKTPFSATVIDNYNTKLSKAKEAAEQKVNLENAVNNLTNAVCKSNVSSGGPDMTQAMMQVFGQMLTVLNTIAENTAKDHTVVVPSQESDNRSDVQKNNIPEVRNVVADAHNTRLHHARDVGAYVIDKMTKRA